MPGVNANLHCMSINEGCIIMNDEVVKETTYSALSCFQVMSVGFRMAGLSEWTAVTKTRHSNMKMDHQ